MPIHKMSVPEYCRKYAGQLKRTDCTYAFACSEQLQNNKADFTLLSNQLYSYIPKMPVPAILIPSKARWVSAFSLLWSTQRRLHIQPKI